MHGLMIENGYLACNASNALDWVGSSGPPFAWPEPDPPKQNVYGIYKLYHYFYYCCCCYSSSCYCCCFTHNYTYTEKTERILCKREEEISVLHEDGKSRECKLFGFVSGVFGAAYYTCAGLCVKFAAVEPPRRSAPGLQVLLVQFNCSAQFNVQKIVSFCLMC